MTWLLSVRPSAILVCSSILLMWAGCGGGGNTGSMTPSSASTSRVVSQGTSSLGILTATAPDDLCDALAFIPFDTTATGDLDAVVDWTFPENDVDVAIITGSCSCEDVLAIALEGDFERCPTLVESESATTKPERISASNAPAGSYTLLIANFGEAAESCSYQVILTTTT